MIPMGYTRNHDSIDVGKNLFHRFWQYRSTLWQFRGDITRRNLRQHGILADISQVVCRPIYKLVTISTKIFDRHVTEVRLSAICLFFASHRMSLSKKSIHEGHQEARREKK